MMNQANLNSGEINPPGTGANQLSSPLGTVCPTWATANGSQFTYEQSFASTYGIYLSNDWGGATWQPDARALPGFKEISATFVRHVFESYTALAASYDNWWRSTLDDGFPISLVLF